MEETLRTLMEEHKKSMQEQIDTQNQRFIEQQKRMIEQQQQMTQQHQQLMGQILEQLQSGDGRNLTRVGNSDQGTDKSAGSYAVSSADAGKSDLDKIFRFGLLRNELMELEKRVQRSNIRSENEEDIDYRRAIGGLELVPVQNNGGFIEKSFEKLRETGMDVLQGTQLLAIDVGAATGLLRQAIIGDELTKKERKFLRRTLTDLVSVVPIGILMLLPVTAVGHAAMLAAIQRYVPALIPSTYGSERLDLLRQLEKIRRTDTSEAKVEDNTEVPGGGT